MVVFSRPSLGPRIPTFILFYPRPKFHFCLWTWAAAALTWAGVSSLCSPWASLKWTEGHFWPLRKLLFVYQAPLWKFSYQPKLAPSEARSPVSISLAGTPLGSQSGHQRSFWAALTTPIFDMTLTGWLAGFVSSENYLCSYPVFQMRYIPNVLVKTVI
jgi:hypothetical protein